MAHSKVAGFQRLALAGFGRSVTPSDWVIKIDTHFLGGGRHWMGRWEIADIGILLMFRRRGNLLRTKVALLQSKRLYPIEQVSDDEPNYIGFGALRESDAQFLASVAPRRFTFEESSYYKALKVDDEQYNAINDYETLSQIPIYYFFYNPAFVPLSVHLPCKDHTLVEPKVVAGCRVLPAEVFRRAVAPKMTHLTPSYANVCSSGVKPFDDAANKGGWRFDDFIVDRVIGCEVGYRVDTRQDATLANLFGGRTAPIYSAVSVNIDVPQNLDLGE